jgi:hypothetical protein
MRELALPKQTGEDDQGGNTTGNMNKTYSMERNKNTLELKAARDGPALTNFSHVLEAVMLKAAKERAKMLSRSRRTDIFWSGRGTRTGREMTC